MRRWTIAGFGGESRGGILGALLIASGCRAEVLDPSREAPPITVVAPRVVALCAGVCLYRGEESDWEVAPARARRDADGIFCEAPLDRPVIPFWTYQRRGDEEAYGVYGLGLEKNPMAVPAPLEGEPVAYPDVGPLEALARIVGNTGGPELSEEVLDELRPHLQKQGVRVVFVLRGTQWPADLSAQRPQVVLWVRELSEPQRVR